MLCSQIGILMRLIAAENPVPQDLYSPHSIIVDDLADPVFAGVGLTGFKNRANAF